MAGLVPFNSRGLARRRTGFEDFYNMLDDFFSDTPALSRNLASDTFKIDVKAEENQYLIEAELPGVKKEELGIALDDGKLTISLNREESRDEESGNYIHRERRQVSMSRSIYLADANGEGVNARLEDGLLKIVVPRQESPKTVKQIAIE